MHNSSHALPAGYKKNDHIYLNDIYIYSSLKRKLHMLLVVMTFSLNTFKKKNKKWSSRIAAPFIPHTCEVVQRRALHPKAQHLLHRQIKRIILVRCHVSAAAARVRTPLYRIAVLGFKRRHGWGNRGGIWMWGGSPRRGSPLPVPLLRLDVRLRSGKGRVDGWSVHPRWWCRWRVYGGHDEDGSGSSSRETHGRLVLHQLALLHNP